MTPLEVYVLCSISVVVGFILCAVFADRMTDRNHCVCRECRESRLERGP